MGYTTYWRRSKGFTVEQWQKICLETFQIMDHCAEKKIDLVWEYDVTKPPEVSPDLIRFNGWKDEGHETFLVTREMPEIPGYDPGAKESFDFCKTARKPYDLAVCLALLSMKRHAPKSVKVSSDGDWDGEWTEARNVYRRLFGVEVDCPFETETV
jgi:hypothetical protein